MTALTLTNVNKSFGNVHVLRDINLEVEDGEFVVFVGPSRWQVHLVAGHRRS